MIIESIKIENFRQYKGPIEVKFSLDDDKNFTIIRGTNGAGKTNLLNAITWCLYGEELHKSDTSEAGGPIFNLITKNELGINEEFFVKVELDMIDEYDNKVIFRRSLKYTNDKNNVLARDPFGSIFDVFYSTDDGDKPLAHPEIFIEKNMPRAIEGYFFFDGEKLEDYFDENSGSSIKDSVSELSQLNLLKIVSKRLNTRKDDYVKQIRKLDKKASVDISKKNKYEEKRRTALKDKEDAIDELDNVNSKINSLKDELEKIDNKDANALQRDLNRLNIRKDYIENQINKHHDKKRDFIISKFPLVFGYSAMNYTCELGKDLEDAGFIPPQYKKDFLDSLLNDKKCICGCDLSHDLEAYNNILNLKNNTSDLTNVSEEVNVTLRDLKKLIESIVSFEDDRKSFNINIRDDKQELSKVIEEIAEKTFEYDNINHPLINKLKDDINDYEHRKEILISKRINAERDYKDAEDKLEKIEREERTQKINNDQVSKLRDYNDFCESAITILESLKIKLTENIRSKIEKSTEEQFKKLMWKDNFSNVSINKNYDVTLRDVTGEIVAPGILSAGEKLVLALSFVAALNSISGFELPFIIDTPMGRLDHEMKTNISRTLPKYVKGNQVALLVTGEEYTESFREGIIGNVGKEYIIDVNETEKGTESKITLIKS